MRSVLLASRLIDLTTRADATAPSLQALKLGGRKAIVLDSRAATLEKLGRIKDALLNAKALVELSPESHKVGLHPGCCARGSWTPMLTGWLHFVRATSAARTSRHF